VRVKGKPVRVSQHTCVPHGPSCLPRTSGAVVNRTIHYSMSVREFRGSKGSCLSATDVVQESWREVSSDCAGAQRYISGLIRSDGKSGRFILLWSFILFPKQSLDVLHLSESLLDRKSLRLFLYGYH
jgi:hypothetical protein